MWQNAPDNLDWQKSTAVYYFLDNFYVCPFTTMSTPGTVLLKNKWTKIKVWQIWSNFRLVLCHKVYYTVGIKKIWGGDLLVIQLTKNGSIQHNIKILTNHIIDEWTLKTFITWSPIFGSSHFRLMICYCICMYSLHTPAENKDESQRERGGEDED